ncbi:MAG: HAMP domain-containing protein [Gemmatimonadaceae bacterium]|nr:HAMP domain-containing protein [Gemmatimonadaceae bacterium]
MKLVYRLLIFSLALITVLMMVVVAIVDTRLQERIIGERAAELGREARLVAGQWTAQGNPEELARTASIALGGRVTLIDTDGRVVGDAAANGGTGQTIGTRYTRPEVASALAGEESTVAPTPHLAGPELYQAVQTPLGIVRVGVHTRTLEAIFDAARRDVVTAGFFALAWAFTLALLFARYVSRPVIQLRDVARALARREYGNHPKIDAPGEVGDLAKSLEHLSVRLETLESVRRDFIANVSHELCSPLTIAGGFAVTLANHDPPPEARKQFARAIVSNTTRMQRVIDDMLDLSRIESGGWIPVPEPIDLAAIIEEVFESLGPAATAKGIALVSDLHAGGSVLVADRTAVRQTIANLTENALRHTENGSITVFTRPGTDGAWLGVRDTGEGIASNHLPRIFERLYRADRGRARRSGGSGLGLAIVKHMAEAHGGRVDAESVVGGGTTIRAFFPHVPSARETSGLAGRVRLNLDSVATQL